MSHREMNWAVLGGAQIKHRSEFLKSCLTIKRYGFLNSKFSRVAHGKMGRHGPSNKVGVLKKLLNIKIKDYSNREMNWAVIGGARNKHRGKSTERLLNNNTKRFLKR